MAQDTNLHQLIINKLTTEQYNAAVEAGTIDETQLYMTTDAPNVVDVKVNGTSVVTGDTANITLGTMASESASDYSKKTVADTLYAAKSLETTVSNHTSATNNPHSVTKSQVGLGNVDNTSDANKPVSTAQQTALNTKVDKTNSASKIYGTDSSGVQTTYDYDSFGKVDDVKVGTVSVVSNKIATLGTMAGENTTSYYNKTELDAKLSGAMHFKGTKATVSALPSTGNVTGDMWNVTETGANYAWDGSQWDKLSENIDLSNLYTKTESDNRFVHLTTDETISGTKTFDNGTAQNRLIFQMSDVVLGETTPSANHFTGYKTIDANGTEFANCNSAFRTDGSTSNNFYVVNKKEDGTTVSGSLGIYAFPDGTIYGTAPTVSDVTDSSTKIVTTEFINGANNNVVHKTGDESIDGIKTFNSAVIRSSDIDHSSTSGEKEVRVFQVKDKDNREIASFNATRSTTTNTNRQRIINQNRNNGWYDLRVNLNDAGTGWISTVCGSGTTTNGSLSTVTNSISSENIPTMGWVNNPATSTNVVHRSGTEEIGGTKKFISGYIEIHNNSISYTDETKSQNGQNYINFWATDRQTGYINSYLQSSTQTSTNITAYFNDGTDTNQAKLTLYANKNGSKSGVLNFHPTDDNTSSYQIDTVGARNTKLGNYVTLATDQTIDGRKTFYKHLSYQSTSMTGGTPPESNLAEVSYAHRDSNGKYLGILQYTYNANGSGNFQFRAYKPDGIGSTYANLRIGYDTSGNVFTEAPTPTKSSNDTNIATTAFVKTNLADYVDLASTQTITGQKTFSETIYAEKGKGFAIKGTEHYYTLRSFGGTNAEGAALLYDNDINKPAWLADGSGTSIIIGNNTILPYSVTPASSDNSTRIATTAFVKSQGYITSSGSVATLSTPRAIDGVSFNGSKNINHFVECSTAAATVAKEVDLDGFVLEKGASVTIKFNVTNTASNPTLNVNNTGAVLMRYRNAAFNAGYLAQNRFYHFVYDGVYWQIVGDLDTSNNEQMRYTNNIKAQTAIAADKFIVGNSSGYNQVATGVTFDLSYPILWAGSAINAGSAGNNNYSICASRNVRNSINNQNFVGTQWSILYLVLSAINGNIATIDSTIVTTTIPTTDDGKYYIPLGYMYSTYQCFFDPSDKIFAYKDGAFQEITNLKANTSLDNLNETGQMIIDSVDGKISNCILEIPERLKLEISGTTITLKSGSEVVSTGSSTYSSTVISSNITRDFSNWGNDEYYLIANDNNLTAYQKSLTGSGTALPSNGDTYNRFYLTSDYSLYLYNTSENAWKKQEGYSYPLCMFIKDSSGIHFSKDSDGNDMIFNGAGFIGQHIFVYPGIKNLAANRFNSDGTLKSRRDDVTGLYIFNTNAPSNSFFTYNHTAIGPRLYLGEYDTLEDVVIPSSGTIIVYIKSENCMYYYDRSHQSWVTEEGTHTLLGTFEKTNNIITKFDIRQPVKLVTTEMLSDLDIDIESQLALKANDADVVHKTGNETIGGTKTFSDVIGTTSGKGISIAGTNHNFHIRSSGSPHDGCSLLVDNDTSKPAWAVGKTGTTITIGSDNVLPYSVTPSASDNSTRIATTEFVQGEISGKANDSDVVHKTGAETINDVKTFTANINANTSVTVGQHAVMSYNSTTEALEFNFV